MKNQPLNFKTYNITSLGSFYLELPSFSSDSNSSIKSHGVIWKGSKIRQIKNLKSYKKTCFHLSKIKEGKNLSLSKFLKNEKIDSKDLNYSLIQSQLSSSNHSRVIKDPNIWKFKKSDTLSNTFWIGSKSKKDDSFDVFKDFYDKYN